MPPHSSCPGERGGGGSEEGATAPPALSHSAGHCRVWGQRTVLQAASPRTTADPLCCPSPLQGRVPSCWGPPGPGYLVTTGAGTAVGAEGVVLAGALVLAGAGEAGVALGLDAEGRWACGTGGVEMTVSVAGVVGRCPFVSTDSGTESGCATGKRISRVLVWAPRRCHQPGKETEVSRSSASSTR